MKCIVNKGFVIVSSSMLLFGFAEGMNFGIKAGLNIADMLGDDTGHAKSKLGFIGGCFVTIEVRDLFAFQPEILYAQKGYSWESEYLSATYKALGMFYYIEIPMLSKIMIPVKGNIKYNLLFGPYLGVNLIAKKKIDFVEPPYEVDIANSRDTEFGMVLGHGVDYILGKGKIGFECRYTLGLTTSSEIWNDARNSVISLMLGYSF